MTDVKLYTHTTEENKQWLEQRVEDLSCSLSEYIHELIQKHIDIVSAEQDYPYDGSERLQTVVEDVHDETDILLREFWGETTGESGVRHDPGSLQLVVLWRLLAGEYSDSDRIYAMQLAQNYVGDHPETVPEIPPTGSKWRDTTSDVELLVSHLMTSDTGSETDQPTDEQDTGTGRDEELSPVDFMTGATGGDVDE